MGIKKITLETVAAYGSSEKVDVSANEMHSKRGKCLLTKSPYRIGQPRTLIPGAFATLFVAIASVLLFYGCKKDSANPFHKNGGNMRVFATIEALYEEVNMLNAMNEDELTNYENNIGFLSFGRASDEIYWQILRDIGEELGYEYLGAEEMNDVDVEFTATDAQVYVSQYPQYLELFSYIAEGSEEGEQAFLPKYFSEPLRYVMNTNRVFRVGENIYKVFDSIVFYTSIENVDILYSITESNIDVIIDEIITSEEAGTEHAVAIHKSTKKDRTNVVCTNCYPPTTGPCGKSGGTLHRYEIWKESFVASNGKEKVVGVFKCESGNPLKYDSHWTLYAHLNIYAMWRGCKGCIWTSCNRTLNTDICMEIWYKDNDGSDVVFPYRSNYKSRDPEKKYVRTVINKDIDIPYPANYTFIRPSIYNICGSFWIATTSYTF